jgi:hypothetical protein
MRAADHLPCHSSHFTRVVHQCVHVADHVGRQQVCARRIQSRGEQHGTQVPLIRLHRPCTRLARRH